MYQQGELYTWEVVRFFVKAETAESNCCLVETLEVRKRRVRDALMLK